jgi:NTE family protein
VLEEDLAQLSGLDRYESVTWRMVDDPNGESGLVISARQKSTGPPFLMMSMNLQNVTSDEFNIAVAARYLAYDVVGSGSELRIDGTLGSNPAIAAELYRPIGSSPLFVAPFAGIQQQTIDVISNDQVVARYGETTSVLGLNLGVNLGLYSDLRVGASVGRLDANVLIGNPGLPSLSGEQTAASAIWRYDTQDSPVIPSHGTAAIVSLKHIFQDPAASPAQPNTRTSEGLNQLAGEATHFWPVRTVDRLFVLAGLGTSFSGQPLVIDQFTLGTPLHLGAYSPGELRGNNYYVLTGGYLKQVGRLPDFMGGQIYAGGWLENGDTFDVWKQATWRTQVSAGVVMDTLIGSIIGGATVGFDSRWRPYVAIGRIFGPK